MDSGLSRTGIFAIVVAALVAVSVVAGSIFFVRMQHENRQALTEFNATTQGINKDVSEKIGKEDTVQGSTDKAQQIESALGKAAAKSSGSSAQFLRAAGQFMAAMKVPLAGYEKAYSEFLSKGGLQPSTLTSSPALDERIALLKSFETANQDFTNFLRSADPNLRAELTKEGFPAREMDATVRTFLESASIETLLAIRKTDEELCTTMSAYLALLKAESGKWSPNEAGAVIFQNGQAAETFNGHAEKLQEIATRQAELQKKVMARQKLNQAGGKGSATGTP